MIAWLFNIRGGDIRHTPVALSYALVPVEGRPTLFIDAVKVGDKCARGDLRDIVDIAEPAALADKLKALGQARARVRFGPETAPMRFAKLLEAEGVKFVPGADPCTHPKAVKNATEIKGARQAHLRDGVALARFLAWLDETADSGRIDEVEAAIKARGLPPRFGQLKDISFDSISAAGPNGAVVHYRPTLANKRMLKPGSLYLIDFRRPISGRHDRRDPHSRYRRADR